MESEQVKLIGGVIASAAATLVGSYFGLAKPAEHRADANREANFSCRDLLIAADARLDKCEERNAEWRHRFMEEEE